ncbi:MAG: hypothetical protein OHK0015_39150 [Chloroflexi bacterium OHK40]
MVTQVLFWAIVAVLGAGQLLLVSSAWRLRRSDTATPGVPRSNPHSDLAWTLATAALTAIMLAFAYLALP